MNNDDKNEYVRIALREWEGTLLKSSLQEKVIGWKDLREIK